METIKLAVAYFSGMTKLTIIVLGVPAGLLYSFEAVFAFVADLLPDFV